MSPTSPMHPKMTGRDRLEICTYGDIDTTRMPGGNVRPEVRYRDGDGTVRKVTATAVTAKQAKRNLRAKLQRRGAATGFGDELSPESTVSELAAAWLADVQVPSDLGAVTKALYQRELNSLVLPSFKTVWLREITTGRLDQFLKRQVKVAYAHARHNRVVLNLRFNYALRQAALHHNPAQGTTRLKQPITKPVALDLDQLPTSGARSRPGERDLPLAGRRRTARSRT